MPIDPSISLGYRSPQLPPLEIQSPLDKFAKMISLRNLMTQQQEGDLGLQQKRFTLGQAQTAAQEDIDLRNLFAKGKPTASEIYATVGPLRGAAIQKTLDAQYEQMLKTNQAKAARLGQLAGSAVDTPSYQNAIMTAVGEGLMAAEHGRELAALDWNDPQTQAQVKQFQQQALTAEQQHAAALADIENKRKEALAGPALRRATAEADKATTEAAVATRQNDAANLEFAAMKSPEAYQAALAALPTDERRAPFLNAKTPQEVRSIGLTAAQRIQAEQTAAAQAETAGYHKARLGIERTSEALRQKQFDMTYGALVDPTTGRTMDPETAKAVAMQDPAAVAIANYQVAPPTMSRGGQGAAILRKALAINPDYDAKTWQQQAKTLAYFTTGKAGQENRATGTALSHVGLLINSIDALNNGNLRILNQFANQLGLETGSTPAAVFSTIAGKVGPELAQAYGEATGGERKGEKANFDPALPPQTLRANAVATAKLLAGKIAQSEFQWKRDMGKRELPMISPEARQVLDSLGAGESAGARAGAKTYIRTYTGPNGHVIGTNDGKSWYDVETGQEVKK